jgi:hypothetical protein
MMDLQSGNLCIEFNAFDSVFEASLNLFSHPIETID